MSNWYRLFIAIPIPQGPQNQLIQYQKNKLDSFIFRPIAPNNLHLTIIFLGATKPESLKNITLAINVITTKTKPFSFILKDINYGPDPHHPRLVWIEGPANKNLQLLKDSLEKELSKYSNINLHITNRSMKPHITLARIKDIKQIPPASYINEELPLEIFATKIILFESKLQRSGAQYTPLYQSDFKE